MTIIKNNFLKSSQKKMYVVGTHQNSLALHENICCGCSMMILMSTNNLCFYGEIWIIILKLSSTTHYICFSVAYFTSSSIPESSVFFDPETGGSGGGGRRLCRTGLAYTAEAAGKPLPWVTCGF